MIESLGTALLAIIGRWGYVGLALLMTLESACIPLPSEIIMPFAGYLVFTGAMSITGATLAGTVGCVVGSLIAYAIGAGGGRAWLERHGRYLLIRRADLDWADRWFARHGDATVFVGRLLPVVRTFIALPAGVSHMNHMRFVLYTAAGSVLWCLGLVLIGARLGPRWQSLAPYFHRFDLLIAALGVLSVALYVRRHRH
ncbi:MAG: DedA family protein [Acidiferrobacteraceae bacterium]